MTHGVILGSRYDYYDDLYVVACLHSCSDRLRIGHRRERMLRRYGKHGMVDNAQVIAFSTIYVT